MLQRKGDQRKLFEFGPVGGGERRERVRGWPVSPTLMLVLTSGVVVEGAVREEAEQAVLLLKRGVVL